MSPELIWIFVLFSFLQLIKSYEFFQKPGTGMKLVALATIAVVMSMSNARADEAGAASVS